MSEEGQSNQNLSAGASTSKAPDPLENANNKMPAFMCVDYPGVVKNVEKAIDSLGGLNKMSHDHFKTAALDLDYHRDNVYSRATCSRRRNGTFLVVKARRRKQPATSERAADESETAKSDDVEGEILGMVSTMHRFTNMFDFQYLPLKRVTSSSEEVTFEDLLPKLFPADFSSAVDWLSEVGNGRTSTSAQNEDMFMPPFVFSRFNTPSFNVLGRETQQMKPSAAAATASVPGAPVVGLSLRRERRLPCLLVHGNEPFPAEPLPSAAELADEKIKLTKPHELVKALFDDRPLWSKSAVTIITGLEEGTLKYLMPKYAFYILSGPFGRVWCRFGHDPRKDPASVIYQTIMVNLAQSSALGGGTRMHIGYKAISTNRLKVTSRGVSTARELKNAKIGRNWYTFEPGALPPFRQIWYQITDIRLPEAEQEVSKALAVENPTFQDSHGWLQPGSSDRIRAAMKDSIAATLSKMDLSAIPQESVLSDDESQEDEEEEANMCFGSPTGAQVNEAE